MQNDAVLVAAAAADASADADDDTAGASATGRTLRDMPLHEPCVILHVDGQRAFRRRLLEMGLVPGTAVVVINVAPLGDPIEIEARHGRLSIRRSEAGLVAVRR